MYIYIDESGDFGWPLKTGSEPYMLFCLLVIDDRKSKQAISQAVSRAILDLRKHHPSCKSVPDKRILELKGSKELCDRPDVRLRFLKRIVKKANFRIYFVILDKRILNQKISDNYMERYSMLLLNILYAIPIPRNQKWVTMVVDSQERAEPTQPVKVRYSSKAKRLRQKRARAQDRRRCQQYNDMITSVFKSFLKPSGTHLKVWHSRSEDDRCLQAVDVIGHFMFQKLRLDEERQKLLQNLLPKERSREELEKNSQWQKVKSERTAWYEAHAVLRSRIEWVRRPDRLHRRIIGKLASFSRQYERQKKRGNREA
jgi:FtsZ-binding cell division protein ZapB